MISAMRKIEKAYQRTRQWVNEIENGESLSPSRITQFKICGLKFYYANILKMKLPPVSRMAFGTAGHAAVNTDLDIKRECGDIVSDKILHELFDDTLTANLQKVDRKHEEKHEQKSMGKIKDEMIHNGHRLLNYYRMFREPKIKPKLVEHRIEYPLTVSTYDSKPQTVLIVNHLDVITKSNEIIDHKFRSRTGGQSTVPTLQMASYALAREYETGKPPKSVRHDVYAALKSGPKVESQFMEAIDPQARVALMVDVQTLLLAGKAGVFPLPERGKYPCTEKWCGYYKICAYGGGGRKGNKLLPSGQRLALP